MRRFIAALFAFALCSAPALATPPVFNGDNISATLPVFNATFYGAVCNGTADDTTAIQNALNAAGTNGHNGGVVLLPGVSSGGNRAKCEAHGLLVQYSNVTLRGQGGAATNYSSTAGTELQYNGTTGGTLISFKAPSGSAATVGVGGGGLENIEIASGSGLAAIGVDDAGGTMQSFTNVSFNTDGGFTSEVFQLEADSTRTIPGSGRLYFHNIWGNDLAGIIFNLQATYADIFDTGFVSYQNGDVFHFAGLHGGSDDAVYETDTDTVIGFTGTRAAGGTGYFADMDCDSNNILFLGSSDPGEASGYVGFHVHGTSTCPTHAPYWNTVYGLSDLYTPLVDAGGELRVTYSSGSTTAVSPGTGGSTPVYSAYDSNILAHYGVLTGNPKLYLGQMNADNLSILFGNTTGVNGTTRIGSMSADTCGTISATVLAVTNQGSGNCLAFDNIGNLGISKAYYGSQLTDGGGAFGVTGNAYKVTFGTLNTATNLYSYGCAASSSHPCLLQSGGDSVNGVTASAFEIGIQGVAALAAVDASGNTSVKGAISGGGHNVCSATSGIPCETTGTCALSAATTCSFTVTVPASSVCNAEANASDTTTVVERFKTSLSSTTLTVTELASASQTATAAANVQCL